MFFCVAEGHVEDGDLEEAAVASEGGSAVRCKRPLLGVF